MRRRPVFIALLVAGGLALAAGTAVAESPVVTNCSQNGGTTLTHSYTPQQLQQALRTMPPTIQEYTACYQTIQNALNKALGKTSGNSGGGGSGGSFLPVWLIVLIVLIVLGGGYMAWRSREGGQDSTRIPPDRPEE
jgi:hypothetical protein